MSSVLTQPNRTYIVPQDKQWDGPYTRTNEISINEETQEFFKKGDLVSMEHFKNFEAPKDLNKPWRGWSGLKEVTRVIIHEDINPKSEKFGLKVQSIYVKDI